MSNKASLYKYTKSGTYYMGYFVPLNIPKDDTDYLLTIDPKYHHKPGRLAYDLYGDENLMWVFRILNNTVINDPIFDLEQGMIIRVPTKTRLLKYI